MVTSPLPYGVACGTPAGLFATAPKPTPAPDGEMPAADAAAAKLTAALERLMNVPLYAVRSCMDAVPYLALQTAWPFCILVHPSPQGTMLTTCQ